MNNLNRSGKDFTFAHREEGFDTHILHSIRGYDDLLDDVVKFSRYFVEDNTGVYDLGCSTGNLIQRILEENQDHCSDAYYRGIENAVGFFDDMRKRKAWIDENHPWSNVEFLEEDLVEDQPLFTRASLITSIFTMQFIPKRFRREILDDVYNGLNTGGAFIFAEKTACENAVFQDMMTFNYYDFKSKNFEADDILEKERTLRHMMKPNTWDEIVDNLCSVGFREYNIQPFWRNFQFVGAIAVK